MDTLIIELIANLPIAGGLVVALFTQREEVNWLRERVIQTEADNQALMEIIIERTNLTPAAIRAMVSKNGNGD